MDRFEAARYLGLADTEVLDVTEVEDGTAVRLRTGGDRLITREDGVFALTDHPSTSGLRRWEGSEEAAKALAARPPAAEASVPVGDGPAGQSGPEAGHPAVDGRFSEGQALPNNREDLEEERREENADEVPDGNADAVLDWVGDDRDRAKRALEVEEGRDHPRSTLISKLRKLSETESS
jgi:hypothetical protein